jgi:hypothetical protein
MYSIGPDLLENAGMTPYWWTTKTRLSIMFGQTFFFFCRALKTLSHWLCMEYYYGKSLRSPWLFSSCGWFVLLPRWLSKNFFLIIEIHYLNERDVSVLTILYKNFLESSVSFNFQIQLFLHFLFYLWKHLLFHLINWMTGAQLALLKMISACLL